MNDDELELLLRDELHRRVVAPEAPGRLHRCVDRMGIDGDGRAAEGPRARMGFHPMSRWVGVLGGLAMAAGIAALLAVSLVWRPSHNPGPAVAESATVSAAPSTASPVAVASPTPRPTAIPTPFPTWAGRPVVVAAAGRLDADFGWVVGNTSTGDGPQNLYVTRDGGTTWQTSTPPNLGISPGSMQFADGDHGAYWADRKVYLTGDGGSTWTSSTVPGPSGFEVVSLEMLDGRRIWAQLDANGQMELWATTDGGSTWSLRLSGKSNQWPQFTFVSETEGWGWLGTIVSGRVSDAKSVHTLDGGRTWTSAPLPLPADYPTFVGMYQPPVVSGGRMVLALLAEATSAKAPAYTALVLVSSDDGGASWNLSSTVPLLEGTQPSRVGQSGSLFWMQASGQFPGPALTFFDPLEPAFSATIDPPTTVCQWPADDGSQTVGGGDGYVVVSTTEAWLSCGTFVGNARELDHVYTTTDGGKTWRGLLGAP